MNKTKSMLAENPLPGRLKSRDDCRGWGRFLILSEGLRLGKVAAALPDSGFRAFLAHQPTSA
jgi:hypothetical protein